MVLRCDIVEQLSVAAVLHNQEKPILRLYNLIQLNNRWMPHYPENVNFPGHSLNVIHIVYLPLVQDLDCHFLPRKDVIPLLHFAEGALAQSLLYLVIANQLFTHVDDLFVLMAPYRNHNLGFLDTCLELYKSARQIVFRVIS